MRDVTSVTSCSQFILSYTLLYCHILPWHVIKMIDVLALEIPDYSSNEDGFLETTNSDHCKTSKKVDIPKYNLNYKYSLSFTTLTVHFLLTTYKFNSS